jgi:uncharacterized protein (TIGR00725 family)
MSRRPIISVIGDASLTDPARIDQMRSLGAAIIDAGFRVVTGGRGGVMEAVSDGARHAQGWFDGAVIGIVPSYQASEANDWCDIVIPSGMQLGRNVLVVSTGAVVVCCGGGAGTLSEIALAWQLGRPIIALGDVGWSGQLSGKTLDGRASQPILACETVPEVIAACQAAIALGQRPEAGEIGSGWRRAEPK